MSTPEPAAPLVQPRCPACGTPLAADQQWCLQCGAAARTRIAPAPRWRAATGVLLALVLLSIAAIGFGVARLLRSDTAITPPPTTITRTIPGGGAATPVPQPAPTPTPAPVPTTPAAPTPTPKTPTVPTATAPPVATTPATPTTTTTAPKR